MLRALKTFFAVCAVFLPVIAICQTNQDYHLTQDPDHAIYLNSVFAHGHRHGYEEGFHAGDEDYQMRRSPSLEQKLPKDKGYRSSFGNRKSYLQGFESGFRAGYADSYTGHAFRRSALALSDMSVSSTNEKNVTTSEFDLGLADGYREGLVNTDNIADQPGVAESASWRCRQQSRPGDYCDGFGAGYVLGRSDSRSLSLLQVPHTTRLAQNSSH